MTATGIPPHVTQLRLALTTAEDMKKFKVALDKMPEELGEALGSRLDEYAQSQGNITFKQCLENT